MICSCKPGQVALKCVELRKLFELGFVNLPSAAVVQILFSMPIKQKTQCANIGLIFVGLNNGVAFLITPYFFELIHALN